MKIRKVSPENQAKVQALLAKTFNPGGYEVKLVDRLRHKQRDVHEWACIHINKVIACIVFSNAYDGHEICGLHLAPLAVHPEFQNRGVGSELLRFALRQEEIASRTVFVLGDPGFYKKFGFEPCHQPLCPFDKDNKHFSALRNSTVHDFSVGYEPEFMRS